MADDNVIHLTIDGKAYHLDPDDLELGEVEILEEEMDRGLDQIDFNRARALRTLVYLMVRRDNPEFTMEDARRIKVSAIVDPGDQPAEPAKTKRPTKARAA